jgi:hypothetical protein
MPNTSTAPRVRITTQTTKEELPPEPNGQAQVSAFYNRPLAEVTYEITRQGAWHDHMARVYRAVDETWRRTTSPVDNKLNEFFDEDFIRAKWGGGRYIVWLYGPPDASKLMNKYMIELEGEPKIAGNGSSNGNGDSGIRSGDPMLQEVLAELRSQRTTSQEVMRATMLQSMDILGMAYKNAVSVVPAAAAQPQNPLMDRLLDASISKMLNPPDPLAGITQIGTMVAAFAGVMKDVTANFKPSTDKVSPVNLLFENLPKLGEHVVGSLHEMRLTAQAQAEAAKYAPRVIDNQPIHTAPDAPPRAPAPQPGEAEANARAANASDTPQPQPAPRPQPMPNVQEIKNVAIVEYLMGHINEMIQHPQTTGAEIYEWMEENADFLVDQLRPLTREQIIDGVFGRWPQLAEASKNPRLPQLIDEFLVAAAKDKPQQGA